MTYKHILKYIILSGLFGALLLPFVISGSQLFPFITGKAFAFRILTEVLLGVWLVSMFFDANIRPKFSWIIGTVFIFVGVITTADIFGVSFYKSFWSNFERMEGLVTLVHLSAYFLVASSVLNTRTRWHTFLNISVVASVIMSVYAFFQLAGRLVINQGGVRVDGTFGNATYLAVYMLFNFFITAFLFMRAYQDEEKTGRWYLYGWYGLAMVLQIVVLYYTATRGAILGLIGGILVTSIFIALFERNRPRLRKISIGILVAVLVLVGAFFVFRNSDFVKNSPTMGRFASLSIKELNTQGRAYVWPMAWKGFKDHPILGWGQENFNYVFNKYYDPRMYSQEPWFDHAHNIILDWLVTGGALGLAGYLSIFVALIALIWRSRTFSVTDKAILIGLLAGYFFQNLFVFDNLVSSIYFFSILAFVHAQSVQAKSEPQWLTRMAQNSILSTKIMPVVGVIAVVAMVYGLNARVILANRAVIKALDSNHSPTPEQSLGYFKKAVSYNTFANGEAVEQMITRLRSFSASSVNTETKQAYVKFTLESLDAQIKKFPNDARALLFAGNFRNQIGDAKGAIPYLEQALEASPQKQSILFELSLSYLSTGDYAKAFEIIKTGYSLAPDYYEAKVLYAVGALYNKNLSLANALVADINQDGQVFDERIVAAYVNTGHLAEAVKLLEQRVRVVPDSPEIRFRLAAGYLSLGQRNKSVEILREAGRLFPPVKDQADYYIKEIQAGRDPTK